MPERGQRAAQTPRRGDHRRDEHGRPQAIDPAGSALVRDPVPEQPILDLFTPHGRTTTSIVHSAPVPPRPLPVPR